MHLIINGDHILCHIIPVGSIYVHLLDMIWLLVSVCINNAGWVD